MPPRKFTEPVFHVSMSDLTGENVNTNAPTKVHRARVSCFNVWPYRWNRKHQCPHESSQSSCFMFQCLTFLVETETTTSPQKLLDPCLVFQCLNVLVEKDTQTSPQKLLHPCSRFKVFFGSKENTDVPTKGHKPVFHVSMSERFGGNGNTHVPTIAPRPAFHDSKSELLLESKLRSPPASERQ